MSAVNPADLAHRAATVDAHPIGAVTGLTAALADGRSEVISDITLLSSNHPGTWSVDPATDVFTCSVAHGLAVGTPISFGAGTGALPAGLSPEPVYYNVLEVPSPTTLKVTATWGGASVDATDAGTAGWVVKNLPSASGSLLSTSVMAMDANARVDVYFTCGWTRSSTNGTPYPVLAFYGGPLPWPVVNGDTNIGTGSYFAGYANGALSKRYSTTLAVVRLQVIAPRVVAYQFDFGGLTSDDTTFNVSDTAVSVTGRGIVYATGEMNHCILGDGRAGKFLSGARAVAIRRP